MATVKGMAATKTKAPQAPPVLKQGRLTPWLYLAPALILMTTFILYPSINTIILSFQTPAGAPASNACVQGQPCWGIFENYRYALTSPVMQTALRNNLIWVILMVGGTVLLGLLIATLADRVKYEAVAKSIIFLPMAISFVGAGVIWGYVYDIRSTGEQIGILNAIIAYFGGRPISWMTTPNINTLALIVVGIWIWTGFCMTILAAALKGVPVEIQEAARVDGANEWHVFRNVTIPFILPTITVVITTMTINVLKVFDIVYVMTGGNFGTEVIANRLYTEMYKNFSTGRATAIAVVLIVLIIPILWINIRRFREQEATR